MIHRKPWRPVGLVHGAAENRLRRRMRSRRSKGREAFEDESVCVHGFDAVKENHRFFRIIFPIDTKDINLSRRSGKRNPSNRSQLLKLIHGRRRRTNDHLVGRATENRTTTLALLHFFRKIEERKDGNPSITMKYWVTGISLLFLIAGGTMLGVGIAVGSAPLVIGGVTCLALCGLMGIFSRMP